MNKTLKEQLKDWKKKNTKGNRRRKKVKKKERERDDLSIRDIESLMGVRRPIYSRGKGGAYRQR